VGGERHIVIDVAKAFVFGECVYIQRDDLSWFVSMTRTEADCPSFTVPYNVAFDGVAAAGNDYYLGYTYDDVFTSDFTAEFD
jgi:hypothetical protein